MAVIKRHWMTTLFASALLLVVWLVLAMTRARQAARAADDGGSIVTGEASDEAMSLDAVSYCELREIQRRLCLTAVDLAAMGCSPEDAESILRALRSWYESNRATYRLQKQARLVAERALRLGRRQASLSKTLYATNDEIGELQLAVREAIAAQGILADDAVSVISGAMTEAQKSMWATARQNKDNPTRYRYIPDLSDNQLMELLPAFCAHTRQLHLLSLDARTAAKIDLPAVEAVVLSSAQSDAAAEAKTRIAAGVGAIRSVSAKILPCPAAMKAPQRAESR